MPEEITEESHGRLEELVADEVKRVVNQRVTEYRLRFRYFLYGLGALIGLLIAGGLLGGGDIVRVLHNKAFLVVGGDPEFPAISYEATFDLRGDVPALQLQALNFFVVKGQRVEIFAQFIDRFPDEKQPNRVFVSVDGNPLSEKSFDKFGSGFYDISNKINWDRPLIWEQNVHSIEFALDDTQMRPNAWVTVVCVVLVKHDLKP